MRPRGGWSAVKSDREVEEQEARWGFPVGERDNDTWEWAMRRDDPYGFYGPDYVPDDDGSLDDNEWLEDGE